MELKRCHADAFGVLGWLLGRPLNPAQPDDRDLSAGKVGGPVLAGGLIHWLDYALTFQLMAAGLLVGAVVVWQGARLARRPRREREAAVV